MSVRARATGWMAMALLAAVCAAQQVAMPDAVTASMPAGGQGAGHAQPPQKTPETGLPEDGLIFLPELKPTDGVPVLAPQKTGEAQVNATAAAMGEKPLLLDRAVAVINGKVILASDVAEQQRFAVFMPLTTPGAQLTPTQAMEQIVNRTLLEGQMAQQQLMQPPSKQEVDQQIAELRSHIPACAGQHCETEEGWQRFLTAHGITETELYARWQGEMEILDFIGARFRAGIHITQPEIDSYYKDKLTPEFTKRGMTPPPMSMVSERIEEVLLQQRVNALLADYLNSLKDAGSVQILDPQYSSLGKSSAAPAAPGSGVAEHSGDASDHPGGDTP